MHGMDLQAAMLMPLVLDDYADPEGAGQAEELLPGSAACSGTWTTGRAVQ